MLCNAFSNAFSSVMHNTALAAAADAQGIKRESTPDLTIGVISIVPVFVCLIVVFVCLLQLLVGISSSE